MKTLEFERIIKRDNGLTFVDFYATWCSPCRSMSHTIQKFKEYAGSRCEVCTIDIDDPANEKIVHRYNIQSVPTLIFFKEGDLIWRQSGALSFEDLRTALERVEKLQSVKTF